MRRLYPMVAAVLLLAATPPPHASTPQEAATTPLPGTSAINTNVVGDAAVVHIKGTAPDGYHDVAVFVKRFSFGWQGIDTVDSDDCSLRLYVADANMRQQLLAGMPKPRNAGSCEKRKDSGPPDDVLAVRALQSDRSYISTVTVVSNYALVDWFGMAGGQALFKKSYQWSRVTSGGGAMAVNDLVHYGVPKRIACQMVPYDAKTACVSFTKTP